MKTKKDKIRRITVGLPLDVWKHYRRKSAQERRGVGPQIVVELERAMAADGGAAKPA